MHILNLGPVVQSIISLTSLLRSQLVKFLLLYSQILLYLLLKKCEKLLNCSKASHTFSTKNIGIFEILKFEILMKC